MPRPIKHFPLYHPTLIAGGEIHHPGPFDGSRAIILQFVPDDDKHAVLEIAVPLDEAITLQSWLADAIAGESKLALPMEDHG